MKVLVSACLLGENCKYNGTNNYNDEVIAFISGCEVTAVCPEVLGGLPVPRKPAEIVDGKVMTEEGIRKCLQITYASLLQYLQILSGLL